MTRSLRLLMPVVIAVVLGPLIAGLAVGVLAIANSLFDHVASLSMVDLLKMFGFYIVFAYVIGGPIALLAGILVSIWMISRPPNLMIIIAAAAIAATFYLGLGALGLMGPVEFTNARANFLLIFVLAMIAAVGCWLLMRRLAPTS